MTVKFASLSGTSSVFDPIWLSATLTVIVSLPLTGRTPPDAASVICRVSVLSVS